MKSPLVALDGDSDEALLSGFAAGDTAAALAFVRRFQGRVYGVALNVLRDPGLAEDAAQEAFVRAWRHAATYDPERGSVAAWLLRTTRNLAIDALRRRRPQPADPDRLAELAPASNATAVEDAALTSEMTDRARAAIDSLPHEQAKVVLLAAFYGYTAQQIAIGEGIPLGTAKTRIRLGLRALRARVPRSGAKTCKYERGTARQGQRRAP